MPASQLCFAEHDRHVKTCVGISHHVTCHVTDHRTHIAAAVAPSFLESTPLQPTGYDPYCVLPTLLRVVCSYLTTYATAGGFALSFTLFLRVEKCRNASKLIDLTEISAERKFFSIFSSSCHPKSQSHNSHCYFHE